MRARVEKVDVLVWNKSVEAICKFWPNVVGFQLATGEQ